MFIQTLHIAVRLLAQPNPRWLARYSKTSLSFTGLFRLIVKTINLVNHFYIT